jgi:tyrosinase
MVVTRHNILKNTAARDAFIQGVLLLKSEDSGQNTNEFGIPGPSTPVRTFDLFVIWHHRAMFTFTPPGNTVGRNSAHRGPVFLPWHRVMLLILEKHLQRVLKDNTFGLPYWDWAADGDLPSAQQTASAIWNSNCMGGTGNPVTTGPFAFSASPNSWRVRIVGTSTGDLLQLSPTRGLRRAFAVNAPTLPTSASVGLALGLTTYDATNWDINSVGFRNRLEGWRRESGFAPPGLHNRVHEWVGGDMRPSSSPNDPVFYLNHCNVDRVWEAWMQRHGRTYLPGSGAPSSLLGHRINDPIASPLGSTMTPADVLDSTSVYVYDALP